MRNSDKCILQANIPNMHLYIVIVLVPANQSFERIINLSSIQQGNGRTYTLGMHTDKPHIPAIVEQRHWVHIEQVHIMNLVMLLLCFTALAGPTPVSV